MIVNAHSEPGTKADLDENPPSFVFQLLQASGVPIDRYSFDTVETLKDMATVIKWRRELRVAQARLAGATQAEAEASLPDVTLEVVSISCDEIKDPEERSYFMSLPTSFSLPPEAIDRLNKMAGQLMRQSPDYESVLRQFNATTAGDGGARPTGGSGR